MMQSRLDLFMSFNGARHRATTMRGLKLAAAFLAFTQIEAETPRHVEAAVVEAAPAAAAPSVDIKQLVAQSFPVAEESPLQPRCRDIIDDYAFYTNKKEGTGQNPKSAACGRWQFMPATWRGHARRCAPWETMFMTDNDLEALRCKDGPFKDRIFLCFTFNNVSLYRKEFQEEPTWGLTYGMHQQGFDAVKQLKSQPHRKAVDVLSSVYYRKPAAETKQAKAKATARARKIADHAITWNRGKLTQTAEVFLWHRTKSFWPMDGARPQPGTAAARALAKKQKREQMRALSEQAQGAVATRVRSQGRRPRGS